MLAESTARMLWVCLTVALSCATVFSAEPDVRFNQIQVIGTHNSYHIEPDKLVKDLMNSTKPNLSDPISYSHKPLAEQFGRLGIRQIELDLFADPKGGLYAEPKAAKTLKLITKDVGAISNPDPNGQLRKPGLKILHIPDIDYRTNALTLMKALKQVRDWSRANPRHVPIFILIELKDEGYPTLTKPISFDNDALDGVDEEILSVFPRSEILTPDEVRGNFSTLPEAIKHRGWPALESVRGRVIFALDNEGPQRDRYLEGHPALKGRVMFATVAEDHPAAAWMKVNDVLTDYERIRTLVRRGFLVRTRADTDTLEARKNETNRRDKALASGAQFVSTDYPEPDSRLTSYCVRFPRSEVARTNPVCGDPKLAGLDLEALTVGTSSSSKLKK